MSNETQVRSSGIGFFGLLTILFIGLKLTGYITWSWWWVLSPMLFGLAFTIGLLVLIFGIAAIALALKNK